MYILIKPSGRVLYCLPYYFFGGITVKHNSLDLGSTSSYAITVSHPPAKERVVRKVNKRCKRILKWMKPNDYYSRLGRVVILILVGLSIATIGFGIWSVSLFIAGSYIAGIGVGILSLASLFWDHQISVIIVTESRRAN